MAQTVLITGASGGVGEAAVRLFLSKGWDVIAAVRSPDKLRAFVDDPKVTVVRMDVADPVSVDAAISSALAQFPQGIDVLVNNAGIGVGGPLEAIDDAEWRGIFAVNVFGVAATIRAILPGMRERGRGVVVNVGSISGRVGIPFLAPYVASKFALEGLSETLQYEIAKHGIRVKLIEPGGIRTEFRHRWHSMPAYEPESSKVDALMTTGTAHARLPEEVAQAIWKAVNDQSPRLRYASNGGGPLLVLRRLLPDRALARLIGKRFLAQSSE